MPLPKNDQNFVQAGSGGQSGWIGKLFGGIGETARARSMAQIQLDLHGERAKIDTAHVKERTTHKSVTEAASKDYLDESRYRRGGRAMKRGIKNAEALNNAKIVDFDSSGIPRMQRTGANPGSSPDDKSEMETTTSKTPPSTPDATPTATSTAKPPADRGKNPARAPRARGASIKDVTAAMGKGAIDEEQATMISPKFAAQKGREAAASKFNPDSPQVTPANVKKPRKPRTPKAGA
jgi:hypothetical protein